MVTGTRNIVCREVSSLPKEIAFEYGGCCLNKSGPRGSIGSATVRKCGLDGVGVALLEEGHH